MDPGRRKFPRRCRVRRRGSDDESQSARIRRRYLRFENAEATRGRILSQSERDPANIGRSLYFYHRVRGRPRERALFQQARSEISGETVFNFGPDRLRQDAAQLIRGFTYANRESAQNAKPRETCCKGESERHG